MADAKDEMTFSERVEGTVETVKNVIIMVIGYFFLASGAILLFLPNPPITPTEECPKDRAERCLYYRDSCANLAAGPSSLYREVRKCRKDADRICAPCDDWREWAYDRSYGGKLTYYLAQLPGLVMRESSEERNRQLDVMYGRTYMLLGAATWTRDGRIIGGNLLTSQIS